ncbi:transcriptional regulator, GntR family [Georgenia satyanarayanai]|uniref:Transcriptional regulator, GntR family n=1 Tax=Georgenia satyanarayanai TaxID=860221 RepID=A0A2Y9AFS2_9MICO|nr:GntR family transcriptional regulator [Georgenia satyanarayanai]PYF99196.1 GntR family transcriptional regulator [Georgenia satyanarayanai]SSA43314.1 transcriptional regulator, GntR family [Georgenia satyanarayanai]
MTLRLDAASPEPPFAQLRAQLTAQIGDGTLRPGDRLPTVRALADELGIAPNTVARAYRELEDDGLLVGRGRAGTFVTDPETSRGSSDDHAAAERAAAAYAEAVHALGLDPREALTVVRRALGV